MNDEIPYNPPGMDNYIREGARKNSELINKYASKTGVELISEERRRQVAKEHYSSPHDDSHVSGELATAGACYAALGANQSRCHMVFPASEIHAPKIENLTWPWGDGFWKPSDDPIRNLAKAGALIAAEIDRLIRSRAVK